MIEKNSGNFSGPHKIVERWKIRESQLNATTSVYSTGLKWKLKWKKNKLCNESAVTQCLIYIGEEGICCDVFYLQWGGPETTSIVRNLSTGVDSTKLYR